MVEALSETPTLAQPGLETRKNTFHHIFFNPQTGQNSLLRCMSDSETLKTHDLKLFQTFCFLYEKVSDILDKEPIELSPSIQRTYRQSTALGSPSKITLDNVQTYFDIFRMVSQNSKTIDEQKNTTARLFSERPAYLYKQSSKNGEINLNPQLETNIELLARAPLGFWGNGRYDTPTKIDGEPVLNDQETSVPLFSPKFIYLVTREGIQIQPPEAGETESLLRHGGCPVLHKDFKGGELIQRTGELYLKFYTLLTDSNP